LWEISALTSPLQIYSPTALLPYFILFCKTVRPMLSDRCLSCWCIVAKQLHRCIAYENWHAGRPRPWPHCVRWGPSSSHKRGWSPQFSAHVCCGQMAGWIKMPLGREVGLSPNDNVLDGDPAPLPKKRWSPPIFVLCLLWPNGWMDEDAT